MIDKANSESFLKYERPIGIFLIVVLSSYFLFYAIQANTDLSDGRYALFMDEQISFDGVKKILHPGNFKTFLDNVLDGNDHRYGRILWNASALFSFIPEFFFDEKGQIIATRMLHTLVLMSSYFILAAAFARTWLFRSVIFLGLLSIPTTYYFFTMPKPEPLQLLFISIFLIRAKKNEFRLGPYWFFMGMAFGCKISALLLILYFGFIAFFQDRKILFTQSYLKKFAKTSALTIAGFLAAEPMFLQSFNSRTITTYVKWTFLNTGHGSDDLTVNWLTWLKYIFGKYTTVPETWSLTALIIIAMLSLFFIISKAHKERSIALDEKNSDNISFVLMVAGLALLLPIIIKVHRLWPMYLHNGAALFITGLVSCAEFNILTRLKDNSVVSRIFLALSSAIVTIIVLSSVTYLLPDSEVSLMGHAARSKSKHHIEKSTEYKYIISFLDSLHERSGQRFRAFYDPNLYLPNSNEKYEIVRFWGPFLDWEKAFEVVIFYEEHIISDLPKETSALYESFVRAQKLYKQYVCSDIELNTSAELCYVPVKSKIDNIKIFVRNNIK